MQTFGERKHIGIHSRLDPVVGLEDGDPLARRFRHALVAGRPVAAVGLVDESDSRVGGGVARENFRRCVGRAVVYAEYLQAFVRLRLEARKRLVEKLRGVVDGHDDGNQSIRRMRHGSTFHDRLDEASPRSRAKAAGWLCGA